MAWSLASHLCAFLFFFPIGLRRLSSFFSLYHQNPPAQFRSRPWYSFHSSSGPALIRNLDFYLLLIALPIAAFSDLYLFLSILPHRFSFLHHHALLAFFWLLLLLILLAHHHSFPIPHSFLFLLAATAFILDFYFVRDALTGPTSDAYHLSGRLSLLCSASCVFHSVCTSSFLAEFALSAGLVLKGTWALQAGLNLFSEAFAFKGCQRIGEQQMGNNNHVVKCDLQEDSLRAIALMNLLFVCHVIGVVLASFTMFAFISSNRASSRGIGDATGPLLEASDSARQPEFVIE